MKIAVLCSLVIVFFLSVQLCDAGRRRRRRTNINWRGINNQNKRHNTNVNYKGVNYNYRGNRWNTNVKHNFRSRETRLNANYRRNHNFNLGYNARNRQTNAGYKYNFGRRRRSIEETHAQIDFFKTENDPKVFLEKLSLFVDEFVENHRATVPELETLAVISVSDFTSNVTVAKEVICLVRKLQRILPNSLGNFIVKMIKFHGPSFNINDLGDFFTVDAVDDDEVAFDDEETCELPEIKGELEPILIESTELLEIKKFVASLIKVAMEYQLLLE